MPFVDIPRGVVEQSVVGNRPRSLRHHRGWKVSISASEGQRHPKIIPNQSSFLSTRSTYQCNKKGTTVARMPLCAQCMTRLVHVLVPPSPGLAFEALFFSIIFFFGALSDVQSFLCFHSCVLLQTKTKRIFGVDCVREFCVGVCHRSTGQCHAK